MKKISVLIADDHTIVRIGLRTLLSYAEDIEVVGEARNGEQAVRETVRLSPDVVVMDLAMPKKDGVAATREIMEKRPLTRVLILTSYGASDGIAHALEVGANGAMMKTADDEKIVSTIRKIADGATYISPDIRRQLEANPPIPRLSTRQTEVLKLLVDGKTSKEIASVLGIRADSVDAVTRALFEKMNVSSRIEAVAIALRKQLISI
jgi:NarL family two-component system response regulator LiaR